MSARRGTALSVLIIVTAAAVVVASAAVVLSAPLRAVLPVWSGAFVAFLLVGRLIAFLAIWRLKRWGLYMLLAFELVETFAGPLLFRPALMFVGRLAPLVPPVLVLLALWVVVLRSKWPEFS